MALNPVHEIVEPLWRPHHGTTCCHDGQHEDDNVSAHGIVDLWICFGGVMGKEARIEPCVNNKGLSFQESPAYKG
jgi:hypothetical protein